ncbi:MAG: DUF6508 domain-containing protein [Pseudomonadota bacterium]
MKKPIKPSRLQSLVAYAPQLRDNPDQFIQFVPPKGKGTSDDPYVMGTGQSILSGFGDQFVKMAYDSGWVVTDFDWAEWQGSEECNSLFLDRAFLVRADENQLARLLTAIIRKDRFAEGMLVHAFESGLMLAIAERAEALVSLG